MTFIPRRGLLAIASAVDIALRTEPRPLSAKQLAARYGLATRHLEPLLQDLVHAGILKGMRGPRGGYALGRDMSRINLAQILAIALKSPDQHDEPYVNDDLVRNVIMPALDDAERMMTDEIGRISLGDLIERAVAAGLQPRPDPA